MRIASSIVLGLTGTLSFLCCRNLEGRPSLFAQAKGIQQVFTNWSGSLTCHPTIVQSPTSEEEVAAILKRAYRLYKCLRVVGAALSPNGLALYDGELLTLSSMD